MNDSSLKTKRTTLKRARAKASYDRELLYKIIDENPICHIAFISNNQPYCIPTLCWRENNHIYWHGSVLSTLIKASVNNPVCITISQFNGLILAKSAFNHSVNYQSAVILGVAKKVEDFEKKLKHFEDMIELFFPNRWNELRKITKKEVNATEVLGFEITQASIKTNNKTEPGDKKSDKDHPVWSGIIPFITHSEEAIASELSFGDLPENLKQYQFKAKR